MSDEKAEPTAPKGFELGMEIRLEYDSMEKAVEEFLKRQLRRDVLVEKVEFLDEDLVWRARVVLPQRPTSREPEPLVVTTEASGLGVDLGDGFGDLGEDEDAQPAAPEGDEFSDGDELPPLEEADLERMGIDVKTPEGRIQARNARREMAKRRSRRARNLQLRTS